MNAGQRWTRRDWLAVAPVALLGTVSACQEKEYACSSTTGLMPEGLVVRQKLAYIDRTKNLEQRCDNCQQYVPAPAAGQCGGCKVMPGPAHPLGYCKVWVVRS